MIQTIKYGSTGIAVRVAKYLMGYSRAGKATTYYDKAFKKFVVSWKPAHGLSDSDVIGEMTWAEIVRNAPEVKTGNKAAIYAFQLFNGLTANGTYNTATKNLIMTYQTLSGLTVDGVCGKDTWKEVLLTDPVVFKHTAKYRQDKGEWAEDIYSRSGKATGQKIANSGCAPTSVASVLTAFGFKGITPREMAQLAVRSGYRKASGGTDTGFFPYVAKKYGLKCVSSTNKQLFKYCLDKGGYPICRFRPKSWWTKVGHFSPAWKYDSKYFYVDNTISDIKIKRELTKLNDDCREFFLFMK